METALSPNRQGRPNGKRPDLIVIHATASSFASAFGWLRNPAARVSAHYLIDKDGRTVLLVPSEEEAWHAGLSWWVGFPSYGNSLNWRAIGYELANLNTGNDPYPEAQVAALVEAVAAECRKWAIPADRRHIVGHWEIAPGRKTDPAGLNLDAVVARVAALLAPTPATYRLRVTASVLNVRQGPATTYPIAGQLHQGEVVVCDGAKNEGLGDWHHLHNGLGFVSGAWVVKEN